MKGRVADGYGADAASSQPRRTIISAAYGCPADRAATAICRDEVGMHRDAGSYDLLRRKTAVDGFPASPGVRHSTVVVVWGEPGAMDSPKIGHDRDQRDFLEGQRGWLRTIAHMPLHIEIGALIEAQQVVGAWMMDRVDNCHMCLARVEPPESAFEGLGGTAMAATSIGREDQDVLSARHMPPPHFWV